MRLALIVSRVRLSGIRLNYVLFTAAILASMVCGVRVAEAGEASATVLVSANDQRFILTDGVGQVNDAPGPGSLTFVGVGDVNTATHLKSIPVSVVGPPKSMDTTPDSSLLLVASSMRTDDSSDDLGQVADNRVTVIDLTGEQPTVRGALAVGGQPSGLRVSPDGRFALVTNRAEGSISCLTIRSGVVGLGPTTQIAAPEAGVADMAITHDAKWMLATLIEAGAVVLVNCDDGRLADVRPPVAIGQKPYAIEFIPGTHEAVIADVSERGMLHHLKIVDGKVDQLDSIYVGIAAEGLAVSGDGIWIAVTCLENSLLHPDNPKRKQAGRLILLRRDAGSGVLRIVDSVYTPRIPQAVIFTMRDGTEIAVGCYENQEIAFYERRDDQVIDTARRVPTDGQPSALCVIESQNKGIQ